MAVSTYNSSKFDLSKYFDFSKLDDKEYISSKSLYKVSHGGFEILKYNKCGLTADNFEQLSHFRSIVFRNGNVVGCSPFKSLPMDMFTTRNKDHDQYVYTELVEGTMVNLYHTKEDDAEWELSTRSVISGRGRFYKDSNKNFRTMFLECMCETSFDFADLNKDYCYSFVIQHPDNTIVKNIVTPRLYLCGVTQCKNTTVTVIDYRKEGLLDGKVSYPLLYTKFTSLADAEQKINADKDEEYFYFDDDFQGLNVECNGDRFKLRNKKYEVVRKLRGNQTKIQYRYLELRKEGNIDLFLNHFHKFADQFNVYNSECADYMNTLHAYYMKCFVKKTCPIEKIPYEYKTHVVALHELYKSELKPKGEVVSYENVFKYFAVLPCQRQMFALNYSKHATPA